MRVLVTGGMGFIGSHLVDRLVAEGHDVKVLDDLSGGDLKHRNIKAKFRNTDLRRVLWASEVIERFKPELVYHLAANAAENKAQFSPIDITSRNWNTFINTLVPAIRSGMKRIVVTSSIAVYGQLQTPFREIDKPEPEDLYGLSKLMMERSLEILSRVHNFEYVITRPHNVYGPRQNMRDPYRNVVTIFMNALLKGEKYFIYGDGEQQRQFSYVGDVVNQLVKCGFEDVAGKTFNLGASKPHTLKELSLLIEFVAGSKPSAEHLPERPQEVKIAIADHSLADELLGPCNTPLVDGLLETWDWCKKQGAAEPVYTELELPNELVPSNWRKAA